MEFDFYLGDEDVRKQLFIRKWVSSLRITYLKQVDHNDRITGLISQNATVLDIVIIANSVFVVDNWYPFRLN